MSVTPWFLRRPHSPYTITSPLFDEEGSLTDRRPASLAVSGDSEVMVRDTLFKPLPKAEPRLGSFFGDLLRPVPNQRLNYRFYASYASAKQHAVYRYKQAFIAKEDGEREYRETLDSFPRRKIELLRDLIEEKEGARDFEKYFKGIQQVAYDHARLIDPDSQFYLTPAIYAPLMLTAVKPQYIYRNPNNPYNSQIQQRERERNFNEAVHQSHH